MSRPVAWRNVPAQVLRFALFAGVAGCVLFAAPVWAGVIYVRTDAAGASNGTSWANAYTDLQVALAAAEWGDEIWVAKGTYKPASGADRTVSFVLEAGVGLYGGFTGAETEREQRNWETNATILSGDIGITGSNADNSEHVVVGAHLAVLDGFTITGGNGDDGGGMRNTNSSPTITNCMFSGNTVHNGGGGMVNYNSSPTVTNCWFNGNKSAYGGGAMYNQSSSPTLTNCSFNGNTADWCGGGMYNGSGSATVTNCTFNDNTAVVSGGGGMCNYNGSSSTVTNCTFNGNMAAGGGGMANSSGSSSTVINCTFSGNKAVDRVGGGISNSNCSPTVINCTFNGNKAAYGGGMYNYYNVGSLTVVNCIFWDNSALSGAEIYNANGIPTFRHCDIRGSGGSGASWDPALGTDGGGNITADPRFVAQATPAGPDGLWRTRDDGLRLRPDSPCIGAADPASAPAKDILGLRRKAAPDIGAYEFRPRASADHAWILFR